jgi:2-polyprenyl-3-methyl-5-hydroxy-6-metoxy-1,4-benzoquinol methylase
MGTQTHEGPPATPPAEPLTDRLFKAALGAFDLAGVYLGDRLGLYRALAALGPLTAQELAAHAAMDVRYAREWLEQQAVTGILHATAEGDADDRRYQLPSHHRSALIEPEHLDSIAPLARMVAGAMGRLPDLVEAYRTGAGVGWERYGADMREGQAMFNRPAFANLLGQSWLPSIEDVDARLKTPGAVVLDVGCGEGWSTIAIARAYRDATVIGVDLDGPSIEAARRNADDAGVPNVEFRHADAAGLNTRADAAVIIEAVHDMSDPVSVLRSVRGALAEDASLIVVDERVAEEFTAPGDDIERFMYGWSVTTCLPDGRSRSPSVATGTVMRPATLSRYAREAGFSEVEVLPIENDFFRFYRLVA